MKRLEDLNEQAENFVNFESGLDWTHRMADSWKSRDKVQNGRLSLGKISLGKKNEI
jgi:hypothetical protein